MNVPVNSLNVTLLIARVSKTARGKNPGKPFAVTCPAHGGTRCIFPKNEEEGKFTAEQAEKASAVVAQIKQGDIVTLFNVGLANDNIIVYDDSSILVKTS